MKLSRKLVMFSAAALMGISPVLSVQNKNISVAQAASKKSTQKGTIKLSHNAYVYDKDGKRLAKYMGSKKNTKIAKNITLKYRSEVKINSKDYYDIGNGAYIKAANVGYVDGKAVSSTSSTTVTLKKNAYVYDGKGKTDKKKLKKGKKVSVDELTYIGSKLYYRLSGQTDQFIKKVNVGKVTGTKLKATNKKPAGASSTANKNTTIITLSHNAYAYDSEGNKLSGRYKTGQQLTVDELKYIGKKLYYHIVSDTNSDQWIKKANVGVITGKQLEPTNKKPAAAVSGTIVTLGQDTNVYSGKGVEQATKGLAKGSALRVSELRYIWVAAENKAELFYKMETDKDGYIKDSAVNAVNGTKLSPVNTAQDAQDAITVATVADKSSLQLALNQSSAVKASTEYLLGDNAVRAAYDTADSNAATVNSSATATVAEVKSALKQLTDAKAALNGQKVKVGSLASLTVAEADQIVKLAAAVNGVDASAISFTNNNTNLTITGTNGYVQTLNVTDYAMQG